MRERTKYLISYITWVLIGIAIEQLIVRENAPWLRLGLLALSLLIGACVIVWLGRSFPHRRKV